MMRLEEFKALNKEVGNHWFSKDTMGFFNSKIHDFDCISGVFISSEQDHSGPRRYTLRHADFQTGRVRTIGEFQEYESLPQARVAYRRVILNPAERE